MGLVLIVENKNTSVQPQYKQRAIKYNVFKNYKIMDQHTCDIQNKYVYCVEDECDSGQPITPCTIPSSYSAKLQVGYNLHYIMDQDGTVDQNCIRAFINKISISEEFSFFECEEETIRFDCKEREGDCLLLSLFEHIGANEDMVDTKDIVIDISEIVSNLFQSPAIDRLLVNETNNKMFDENFMVYKLSKNIRYELFQYDSILLKSGENTNYILDSFTLSANDEGGLLTIQLSARLISITPYLTEYTGDLEPVDVSARGC